MVKISTSLVIAAVAAQSIAAPIFENRENSVKAAALHELQDGARVARKLFTAHHTIKNQAQRKKTLEEKQSNDQELAGQQQQLERQGGHAGRLPQELEAREPLRGSLGPKPIIRGPVVNTRLGGLSRLEAREPRISGAQLRSIGHHVKSGIELAATVAPLLHQREDGAEELYTREPRISGSQLRSIGHHVKSGIELAATVAPLIHQRSVEDDEQQLERRFGGRGSFHGGRHFGGRGGPPPMQSREIDDIEAREPRVTGSQLRRIGHHVKTGIELGATVAPLLQQREEEFELDARDPFNFGKFIKGAAKGAGKVAGAFLKREDVEVPETFAREFDDAEIDAREPEPFNFGKFIKGAAKGAGKVAGAFLKREEAEAAEMFAREPEPFNFGKFIKGAAKGAGKVAGAFLKREDMENAELFTRQLTEADIQELAARDPFFLTKLVKGAAKVAGNFLRREDMEDNELFAREFTHAEIQELAARDPFFLTKLVKGAAKVAGNFLRREEDDGVIYARELEIDELD